MTSPQSLRPRSTPEEIDAAFSRATRALQGVAEITIKNVAKQAANYVTYKPEGLRLILKKKTEAERIALGFPDPKAPKPETPQLRLRKRSTQYSRFFRTASK